MELIWIFVVTCTILETTNQVHGATHRKFCPEATHRQPAVRTPTRHRIEALRAHMRRETSIGWSKPLDAYIITSDDEHQSEIVAPCNRRREYMTGFTGSTGDAVITQNRSVLWVDGRYHIQADNEVSCDWELVKQNSGTATDTPTLVEWLVNELPPRSRVGADPKLISNELWEGLSSMLKLQGSELVEVKKNLVDLIWERGARPPKSKEKAYVWDLKYAGVSWEAKVNALRSEMHNQHADALVVTALDEIAWLLNIRGSDIPFSPLLESYAIITSSDINLYVDLGKITSDVRQHFRTDFCASTACVKLHEYNDFWDSFRTFSQVWGKVYVPNKASYAVFKSIRPDKIRVGTSPTLISQMKSVKNYVERKGLEHAHIRDGAILCDFLAHFEEQFQNGEEYDELKMAKEVDSFRYELMGRNLFKSLSFKTIVAYGYHGAQPHYEPKNETSISIGKESTIVIDSGGQYLDGTTDVTRTLHLGTPTKEQKEMYTRVLMGQIQLSSLIFPKSMPTNVADVMARSPLWSVGMDFMHGTGHGVGSFLNVHETPPYIQFDNPVNPFEKGNFVSNEPGFYKEGDFGIRLENVLEVIAINKSDFVYQSDEQFFKFKDVTLVPYENKLMDAALLTAPYRRWLNEYNARIRTLVGAELKREYRMKGFYWMMKKTNYIPEEGHISRATTIYSSSAILFLCLLYKL